MKMDCDVIRDILPLYADEACSDKSRALVEEHLGECEACREELAKMRATELESGMRRERINVIDYAMKRFRRRSTLIGMLGTLAAAVILLILLILIGPVLARRFLYSMTGDWYYTVLASLAVLASVTVVPILMPRDKLFWTFCAFTASRTSQCWICR